MPFSLTHSLTHSRSHQSLSYVCCRCRAAASCAYLALLSMMPRILWPIWISAERRDQLNSEFNGYSSEKFSVGRFEAFA